ncbi:MAG: hypothetical protein WBC44_22580 [Planctomycetaceae bacterium]
MASAGPAFAASSAVETLDAAVVRELNAIRAEPAVQATSYLEQPRSFDAQAPRDLPDANDPSIRPVSGHSSGPPAAQPTPAQLEVMRQLEEMYQRDGRGPMPSLRLKDAPNTRLPNGQRVVPPQGEQFPSASGVQPASGFGTSHSSAAFPPAPAPAPATSAPSRPVQPAQKPKKGLLSWFRRDKEPQPSHSAEKNEGGLFSRMFRPFRREDEKPQYAAPSTPPVPPPLPDFSPPVEYAVQPSAPPQALPPAPARPVRSAEVFPPPAPPVVSAPVPSAPRSMPAETLVRDDFGSSKFVSRPETPHPLDDPFASVRDVPTPETSFAELDPDFSDAAPESTPELTPATVPAAIAADDPFGSIRPDEPSLEQQSPAPKPSAEARYAELQRKLAERAGLGGFQGFCPVALHDRRELVDSRPEFICVFEGRTYEVSSAQAKVLFDADPEKYAPVNRGNDVVLTARGETEVEGNLNYAVWFKDRLYLFRTAETLREFDAAPKEYAVNE